jgi:beta-lactamase superfamily II metal-dependent hydrolase
MNFRRTFHPIGQGAFYTERHKFNETEFTAVYDCGSSTFNNKKLETKIKSTFPKDYPIDVLFISHFHADHINGIEILNKHCKIKRVVMPLIDDTAKILCKVANLLDNEYFDARLIDSPEDFFGGDVAIIRIEETDINPNTDGVEPTSPLNISDIEKSTNFPSGTQFGGINNWIFIPFNYKHEECKKQFEKGLQNVSLTLVDIDTTDKITKNKTDIIKAYKAVDGDLNQNSMILYSGKDSDYVIECIVDNHSSCKAYQSGCLYMGDVDLKEPKIVTDIIEKLKKYLPYIGTLQVPHHGSIHNFDSSVLKQLKINCAIFSYGTTNNYGHPSDTVIGDIIANNIYPHHVTEQQHSMVTQVSFIDVHLNATSELRGNAALIHSGLFDK